MKKPVVNHHKAHMSLRGRPSAPVGACGRQRSRHVPRTAVAGAEGPAAGLAFAAVRPGFFAACIVEAVAEAGGAPATPGAGPALSAARAGRPWRGRHPGAVSEPSRRLGPRGGGPRAAGDRYPRQGHRNGQMGYFSKIAAVPRKVAVHRAAITPRERAVAWDLVLTTLSGEPCVQSSIFGFVAT